MVNNKLLRRGIPKNLLESNLLNWDTLSYPMGFEKQYGMITSIVKSWTESLKSGMNLFLGGMNGCGKTFYGCLALKTIYHKGIEVIRKTMFDIQKEYSENWTLPEYLFGDGIVAFIEEIGKEHTTKNEYSERNLEVIIKTRYEKNLPTILSSNADIESLRDRYGNTVVSMLKASYIPVIFPEVDFRAEIGDEKRNKFLKED